MERYTNTRNGHIRVVGNGEMSNSTTESDMAIEIARQLAESRRFGHAKVDISMENGVVCLRGRAASYFQKQVAQVVALAVAGVGRICNDIEVH